MSSEVSSKCFFFLFCAFQTPGLPLIASYSWTPNSSQWFGLILMLLTCHTTRSCYNLSPNQKIADSWKTMKNHNPTKQTSRIWTGIITQCYDVFFSFSLVKFQQPKCLSHGSIRICLSFFNSCCFSCRAWWQLSVKLYHLTWSPSWSSIWCLWNSVLEIGN